MCPLARPPFEEADLLGSDPAYTEHCAMTNLSERAVIDLAAQWPFCHLLLSFSLLHVVFFRLAGCVEILALCLLQVASSKVR